MKQTQQRHHCCQNDTSTRECFGNKLTHMSSATIAHAQNLTKKSNRQQSNLFHHPNDRYLIVMQLNNRWITNHTHCKRSFSFMSILICIRKSIRYFCKLNTFKDISIRSCISSSFNPLSVP